MKEITEDYERGAEDAVNAIFIMWNGGIPVEVIYKMFGTHRLTEILDEYSGVDIINKVNEYVEEVNDKKKMEYLKGELYNLIGDYGLDAVMKIISGWDKD